MSLKTRLSRLQTQAGGGVTTAAPPPALSDLRNRIARLEKTGRSQTPKDRQTTASRATATKVLAGTLEGDLIAEGVIRISKTFTLANHPAGTHPGLLQTGKRSCLQRDPQALRNRPRLPGERRNDKRRQVYIDTETTGLSGGSGTLAFLIGIAVVENASIALSQFLITGFSAEAAMLSAFAHSLSPDDRLVSYNGKSYDLPLLVTRFRMQAMTPPFEGLPHLDLLHPVRRLFARRWNDCRLLSLEKNLLGYSRIDDLPGSEAPAAWFSFIRSGIATPLIRVVEHNRQDIVSLAIAHSTLAEAIKQPRSYDVDLHALARWISETDEDAARKLLQSNADSLGDEGKRLLGLLCRRTGYWQQAVSVWEALAASGCSDSLLRLAKYHEHISKDLTAAWRYCELLPSSAVHDHRRKRISAKIEKQKQSLPDRGYGNSLQREQTPV